MTNEIAVAQIEFGRNTRKRRDPGRPKDYPEDKEPKQKISITVRPSILKQLEKTEIGKKSRSHFFEKCYYSSMNINPVSGKFIVGLDELEEEKE